MGRKHVVHAAAELIGQRGAATSLDDVRAVTGASKSQLCHYFGDDRGLVESVVEHQCATVVGWHARTLAAVARWEDLERWAELIVAGHSLGEGCPIGTLAAILGDADEELRARLNEAFTDWSHAIRGALNRLRENGLISAGADLDALATMTLSAIQGGLLLAKTSRDTDQLRAALTGALAELRARAT